MGWESNRFRGLGEEPSALPARPPFGRVLQLRGKATGRTRRAQNDSTRRGKVHSSERENAALSAWVSERAQRRTGKAREAQTQLNHALRRDEKRVCGRVGKERSGKLGNVVGASKREDRARAT